MQSTGILSVTKLGSNFITIEFEKPANFHYSAGQFIEIQVPHSSDNRGDKRWFTLSSAPDEEHLAVITRLSDKPSSFKKRLSELSTSDELLISQAMGDFVLPLQASIPLCFIVKGIGVTPLLSILKSLKSPRDIAVFYAVRNATDILDRTFIDAHTKLNLLVDPNDSYSQQLIPGVLEHASANPNCLYYISGPEPFTEAVFAELSKSISTKNIITDYFHNYVD